MTRLRHRLSVFSVVGVALGGFFACTFGANDFQIVPKDGASAGTSNEGGSSSSNGGDGAGGDANGTGASAGSDGQVGAAGDGSGLGGAGAGGAGPTPTFSCTPQGTSFTVLSAADLDSRKLDGPLKLLSTPSGAILVASSSDSMNGKSRIYYRAITDSAGGSVDQLDFVDVDGGRLLIGASAFINSELKVMGVGEKAAFELTVPTVAGRQFGAPVQAPLPLPMLCQDGTGSVRDLAGDYHGAGLSYAVTCASPQDDFSLHLVQGLPLASQQLAAPASMALDNIVRQYTKVGDQHLLLVGEEVGPTIGVRYGSVANLSKVAGMGLSTAPGVFSSFGLYPQMDSLFLVGISFTTDDPNPPPLVPATIYAGSVPQTDISSLFANGNKNRPPAALQPLVTYTKASQLVSLDDAVPFGQNVLAAGASVAPRERIDVSLLTKSGVVLAPPKDVYQTPPGALIADHSITIARLGLGVIVAWSENDEVKARAVSCLQD